MATVNYSLRIDETDKQRAEQVFNELGLSLAAGLNIYLKAVIRKQRIPFDLAIENSAPQELKPDNVTDFVSKHEALKAISGILTEFEVDLEKEREERIISQ
jgi:DNA-damage-inducible protein J